MSARELPIAVRPPRLLPVAFGLMLLARLLYPFFNSPLNHLFSDPLRHWDNAGRFPTPSILGSIDPFLYQAWLFVLRRLSADSPPAIELACGVLCAALPYGWYRSLREIEGRERALCGALLIGAIPESISLYGYFMNETLLMALLGLCFWTTLRAARKRTPQAFALTALLWSCATFTRSIAAPMAASSLLWLWAVQDRKSLKAVLAVGCIALLAFPAAWHSSVKLGFAAPLGNFYFNEIYAVSGKRDIEVSYGREGSYHFGCPSFYAPSFYPWSPWTTERVGVATISVDLERGRTAWLEERQRMTRERTFPVWRDRLENLLYVLFSQNWPNSDPATLLGRLTLWTRWLWAPLIAYVALRLVQRRFRGVALLVPLCALGTVLLLLLQNEAIMEARFREPVDALLICAAWLKPRRAG